MSTPPNDLQQQQILQSSNLTTTTTNQSDNSDKLNLNKSKKITIILKAAGSAPILKTKKWEVDEAWTVAFFQQSLRKLLKLTSDQSLFIFVNQSFSPSPEHTIGTLQKCFGSEGNKLTLYYSTILAWG